MGHRDLARCAHEEKPTHERGRYENVGPETFIIECAVLLALSGAKNWGC